MAFLQKNSVNFAQCDGYVLYILQSGLLLDEDMDCILAYFNADDENSTERKLTFTQKVLSGISISSAIFLIQQKCSMLYLPIAVSPLLLFGIQHLREKMIRKNQQRNIEMLIKANRDIFKLNRTICEYYRLRNSVNLDTVNIMNPYTRGMKQLLEMIFKEEVNLLFAFRGFAWKFGEYIPTLRIDFEFLEKIDFEQFNIVNIDSINDCVMYLEKLHDIFVMVVSGTLTCVAVSLCANLATLNEINIDQVLDTIIPKMKKMSLNCYNKINKKFDNVKYYHLNKKQDPKQLKPADFDCTSKLYTSTSKVMACSSDVLERSQMILKHLEKHHLKSMEEKIEVSACIAELRSQVFDFYQSLDVLHKVFEINLNRIIPPQGFKPEANCTSKDSLSIEFRMEDASLNPIEPSDDEEFEVYVGANDVSSEAIRDIASDEEEGRQLAFLVGRELKQQLKTHAKFVAARQKRGIADKDPEPLDEEPPELEEEEDVLRRRRMFPFDANDMPGYPLPIAIPSPPLPNCEPLNRPIIPPPPPPPLPPINLGQYVDVSRALYTVVDDFLVSIRSVSRHRVFPEEVYESRDVDEE